MNGLCECGCGERTRLAPYSTRRLGWVQGRPIRFINGHSARGSSRLKHDGPGPNPSGLCLCGCGGTVPIAPRSDPRKGWVQDKPIRFLRGHSRKPPPPVLDPATGCVLWQGRLTDEGRPFIVTIDGRRDFPYRLAWASEHGPIPKRMHIHHTCETPACVNVEHMECLTPREHNARHGRGG